jgi:glycine/D-amino acid oxidase-like deaminating enzyme
MSATGAEAIVIGAGVIGSATAYELSRAGVRTVLLERGAPNRESSGTTAGNIHIQAIHSLRPGQRVPSDFTRFLPLQRTASGLWDTLEAELDADLEVRRVGGFMVAETLEQAAHLRAKWELEQRVGIASTIMDGDAARAELPLLSGSVLAATYCAEDGYANPLKVGPAYLTAARRHGLMLHCFAPVIGIRRAGAVYRVQAGDGTWEAPIVVNASGAWLDQVCRLAGIDLRMEPCALQMHATERTAPRLRYLIQHIGEGLSVKQVAAGNILIGGGWPGAALDLEGRSPAGVASMFGNLWQARRILPFLGTLRLLRVWAGPFATTPDELPVIGEVPGHPGLLVIGGSYGFTLAPLWGKILCELALGRAPRVDLSGLGPERLLGRAITP